jgi:hypothetical protein
MLAGPRDICGLLWWRSKASSEQILSIPRELVVGGRSAGFFAGWRRIFRDSDGVKEFRQKRRNDSRGDG